MKDAKSLFGRPRALIGMVHLAALPGTPRASTPIETILERATSEARTLVDAGFDALLVENMNDAPYLQRSVGPEITAMMTQAAAAVRREVDVPVGVQVLAGANREALAIALATSCAFVRVEGFAYAAVADEGWIEADAGALLRYRRAIGAESVAVLADIKKKHSSHAVTADLDIEETARGAAFCGAEALVVTGSATGAPTDPAELARCRDATHLPVLCGSGTTPDNVAEILEHADGAIVGSWIKEGGHWSGAVNAERSRALVEAAAVVRREDEHS